MDACEFFLDPEFEFELFNVHTKPSDSCFRGRGHKKRIGDEVFGACEACGKKGLTRRSNLNKRWSRHITYNPKNGSRKYCGRYLPIV